MFLAIAGVLFLIWIAAFLVFHVTAFFIHVLILFAIISLIAHFVRGGTKT